VKRLLKALAVYITVAIIATVIIYWLIGGKVVRTDSGGIRIIIKRLAQ
jgi:hypothetical protein